MHEGSIFKDTAEGRSYRYMKARKGLRCDAWDITETIKTTAVGTHMSGVNKQLRLHGIPEEVRHVQEGRKHYYVLIDKPIRERTGEQLALAGV